MMKRARNRSLGAGRKSPAVKSRQAPVNRSWPVALIGAGALVGAAIFLSAVVNPLFGRFVHWDWMAALAPPLFVLIALSLRRRWV